MKTNKSPDEIKIEIINRFGSQKKLAELLGMTESALSKGISRMSKKLLLRIASLENDYRGNNVGTIKISKTKYGQHGIVTNNNGNVPHDYELLKAENKLLREQIDSLKQIITLLQEKNSKTHK